MSSKSQTFRVYGDAQESAVAQMEALMQHGNVALSCVVEVSTSLRSCIGTLPTYWRLIQKAHVCSTPCGH